MSARIVIDDSAVEEIFRKLNTDSNEYGYNLNPDVEFTKQLIKSLLINEKRYGYWACPCRLASGVKSKDLDIICPCDYRDSDLNQFGSCFCALYVSREIAKGQKSAVSIPERRPSEEERKNMNENVQAKISMPVWRCKVCGYLCAREEPPELCPICKAEKERFERFM
ncbi:MAG: ferredoxin-thioredoxin reductase catalytic domain-containing protein [Candidatus Bathyarchaeota archaeon]